MKSFPPEIWRLVLKEAAALGDVYPYYYKNRNRTICACALVCTMWTPIAQELLWEQSLTLGSRIKSEDPKFTTAMGILAKVKGLSELKVSRFRLGLDTMGPADFSNLQSLTEVHFVGEGLWLLGYITKKLPRPLHILRIRYQDWSKRDVDALLATTAGSPAFSRLKLVKIGVSQWFDWDEIDPDGEKEGGFKQYGLDVEIVDDGLAYVPYEYDDDDRVGSDWNSDIGQWDL
ncbi:hypothetical protein RQP46_009691 [Phenoliferia psychrophenolica]